MSAIYYKTSDTVTPLFEILPLESNGPGNLSVPRQIVDVEFLDKSFATPTDAFIVNDDVSARFVQGFTFNVIGSGAYDGSYVVDGGAFAPGDTVAQVVDGKTHIPVAEADATSTSTPYDFRAGFVTPLISPTTPHNYLVTWEVAGDMTALVSTNDTVQIKHFLYNGTRVNRVYTVSSVTLDAGGTFTRIVTLLTDDAVNTPVIGVDVQSVLVSPVPTPVTFGYVQYTVPTSATSLRIVGKGSPAFNNELTWGNAVQSNLIHMLENFAHDVEPTAPMTGQLWFDTSVGGPALRLRNDAAWYGVVASGLPVQGDIDLNNYKITNLADATLATDALNMQTGDSRYVNVTGDTMTGALTLSGDPTLALHASTKQYVDNTTVSLSGDTMTGPLVLNANPTAALGAATKQYVDSYVSGIIWLTPLLEPNLFNDTLSAPPADDGFTKYHKTFIVAGTGTGAWTGFNGHLMAWDGTSWVSVLGRAVSVGDRFGVFMEPDNDDPLSTLPGGGLTGHAGKIATVTGVSPYTYTFYTPAEPDAVSIKGIADANAAQSVHMGHSYTFRGVYGTGAFGSGYAWIEFAGPQMIVDGAGLRYDASTLNIGAGTGITVNADSVQLDITYADNRYVNATGDTMTGALTLSGDPTLALHAATKQYVDGVALLYFTPNRNISAPNATIPVHSLTATGTEVDIDVALVPKGTGAIAGHIADGTVAGGNKRGSYAVDWQVNRSLADEVASGVGATVAGGSGNKASNTCATVAGGGGNYAAAMYAAVGGGSINISSGNRSTIAGGNQNTASGGYAVVGGGSSNTASAEGTTVSGGVSCSATAIGATVSGGTTNVADGQYSTIPGGRNATTRGNFGRYSYASGLFATTGDAQISDHVLHYATADATATVLSSDGGAADVANTTAIPDNHAYTVVAYVTARNTSNGDMASWKIEGAIKRGTGAASTSLVGTPVVSVIAADAGAASWVVAMVANTTRGSAEVQVTGAAATTIHWVCKLSTVEVG